MSQLRSWRDLEKRTQQSKRLAPCQRSGYVKKRAEMLREVKNVVSVELLLCALVRF